MGENDMNRYLLNYGYRDPTYSLVGENHFIDMNLLGSHCHENYSNNGPRWQFHHANLMNGPIGENLFIYMNLGFHYHVNGMNKHLLNYGYRGSTYSLVGESYFIDVNFLGSYCHENYYVNSPRWQLHHASLTNDIVGENLFIYMNLGSHYHVNGMNKHLLNYGYRDSTYSLVGENLFIDIRENYSNYGPRWQLHHANLSNGLVGENLFIYMNLGSHYHVNGMNKHLLNYGYRDSTYSLVSENYLIDMNLLGSYCHEYYSVNSPCWQLHHASLTNGI